MIKYVFALFLSVFTTMACAAPTGFAQRPDVQQFINTMVKDYPFKRPELVNWFDHVKISKKAVHAMKHPKEAMPWYRYQQLFVKPERVEQGLAFWQKYHSTLTRAEKQYGVPAQIIIAIIGVESHFGAHKGKFPVFNTLATFAFTHATRQKFFTKELKEFLLFSREEKLDPLSVKGSYAGAMGQPQFMPSSYRAYAVDFSGDGKRDLMNNEVDVIGSVANYLSKNGWHRGEPIAVPALVTGEDYLKLPEQGRKPSLTLKTLAQYHVQSPHRFPGTDQVLFMPLKGDGHPDFWLGFHNFYVITRYNTSKLYALAVYQLGEQVLAKHHA